MDENLIVQREIKLPGLKLEKGNELVLSREHKVVILNASIGNGLTRQTPLVTPFQIGGNSFGLLIWNEVVKIANAEGWNKDDRKPFDLPDYLTLECSR